MRKAYGLLAAAMGLLMPLVTSAADFTNWNLADGIKGWEAQGRATLQVAPGPNDGMKALQVTDSSDKRGFARVGTRIPVLPNAEYTLSGMLKSADGAKHAAKIMTAVYDKNGKMYNWVGIYNVTADGQWKSFKIKLTTKMLQAAPGAAFIQPAFFPEDKAADQGSVLFANIKLVDSLNEQGLLSVRWPNADGTSGWKHQPSQKPVEISRTQKYYGHPVLEYSSALGSVAASENTFTIKPGKKYVFGGNIRTVSQLSNSADNEKDLAQMGALLATSSVYDASVGVAYTDDEGNLQWLVKKNFRFTSVWQAFHMTFALPEGLPQKEARAYINVYKKDCFYQSTKLSILEGSAAPLPVERHVNRPYRFSADKPGWTGDPNHDVRHFKGGDLTIAKIPFQIPSEGCIGISRKEGFKRTVEIPLNQDVDFIYILNTAAWANKGIHVANVRWNFFSGESVVNKVVSGLQTGDWYVTRMQTVRFAFHKEMFGICPVARSVFFFVTPMWNPRMGKPVKSLTLEAPDITGDANENDPIWMVMGLSLGQGGNIADEDVNVKNSFKLSTKGWYPFDMRVSKTTEKPLVDLREFVDAPAGKHGFLQCKDGHFVFQDGTPARFLGAEVINTAHFPSHEEAEAIADTMARYGINMVRMRPPSADPKYVFDPRWYPKNADLLDRFDYFFYCLKKRGIYLVADLSYRITKERYQDAGGFEGIEAYFPQNRPWHYYDPIIQGMWLKFVQEDFSRVNPYTGLSYFDDPAIALAVCFNESGLLWDYRNNRGTPEYYKNLLRKGFSKFLQEKYGSREKLAAAWQNSKEPLLPAESPEKGNVTPHWNWELHSIGSTPSPRDEDSIFFYYSLQKKFNTEITAKLRKMGLRVPVASTNAGRTPEMMDYTSQNSYYDHNKWVPKFDENGKFCGAYWEASNIPETVVNPMLALTLQPGIASSKMAGKPHTATETNIMWPQDWRSMHMVNLVAAANLQGWDMMLQFAFLGSNHHTWEQARKIANVLNPCNEYNDPAMYGPFPAMAIAWHRNDISTGKNLIQRVESVSEQGNRLNWRSYSFPANYLTWLCRYETSYYKPTADANAVIGLEKPADPKCLFFKATVVESVEKHDLLPKKLDSQLKAAGLVAADRGLQDGRIVSDTGEITRDWQNGRTLINTPRTQGFTGYPTNGQIKLNNVEITGLKGFATIILNSLDGKPLNESSKIFLTTVGRAANSHDTITYKDQAKLPNGIEYGLDIRLEQKRKGEVLAEPILCKIHINGQSAKVTPLKPNMCAASDAVTFKATNNNLEIALPTPTPSPWYLLEIQR